MSSQGDVLLDYTLIVVHERRLVDVMIKSELDGETFSLAICKFDLNDPAISSAKEMETVSILHYPQGMTLKRSSQGSVSVGKYILINAQLV